MSNMSYCRFQNTVQDLMDCRDAFDDIHSKDEERAAKQLVKICADIVQNWSEDGNSIPLDLESIKMRKEDD